MLYRARYPHRPRCPGKRRYTWLESWVTR
jgi:hypothetical protein